MIHMWPWIGVELRRDVSELCRCCGVCKAAVFHDESFAVLSGFFLQTLLLVVAGLGQEQCNHTERPCMCSCLHRVSPAANCRPTRVRLTQDKKTMCSLVLALHPVYITSY